jgi:D-glycero-D-manno-heptose 1,7-bisphosphate phosphatase
MNKAIFLDRDGTLIEDVGHIKHPRQIYFFPDVFRALNSLPKEFLLFIITNQTGIAKGQLKTEEVNEVNEALVNRFREESIIIQDVFVCPHAKEDNCSCRKPNPYFLLKSAEKYNLDLTNSYMIGDHPEDVYCAEKAGLTGIYLLTGHGLRHLHEFSTSPLIRANILDAANYINSKSGSMNE